MKKMATSEVGNKIFPIILKDGIPHLGADKIIPIILKDGIPHLGAANKKEASLARPKAGLQQATLEL